GEQFAALHGADHHVAVERETDAAEHADLAAMRMPADLRPDAVGQLVAFSRLARRFHSARHYGRDILLSQFALSEANGTNRTQETRPSHHPRRASARREYRHGRARHGEFRPGGTQARQPARRLAERQG